MAARRSKSQARRNPSGGLPGWAWLVIGVLVTLLVVLAAPRLLKSGAGGDGFLRIGPKPDPDAQPATSASDDDALAPDVATNTPASGKIGDSKSKPQYDFYTLLPGEEVAMSDAELAASAKAEAEARTAAQTAAARAGTSTAVDGLPPPIAENPDAAAMVASATATNTTPNAGTTAAVSGTKPAATTDARYILQAGAFGGSGDAETVKAKIAMLGLNARVEAATIGGKTVYRVRMGPYGTASELADAKAKLSSSGLPAMAVKTN
ncbi:MAG: SPOR domain-containing protein [Thermomonas sp.]